MTLQTLRFDDGVFGSLASKWSYSRPWQTKDGKYQTVAADAEPFQRKELRHRWKQPRVIRDNGDTSNWLFGGEDVDGEPMGVYGFIDSNGDPQLIFYRGRNWSSQNQYVSTVDGQSGSKTDILRGARGDGKTVDSQAWGGNTAGVVTHGTFFFAGQRKQSDGTPESEAIAYTQDYGQTWSLVKDQDGNDFPALEAGRSRGNRFIVQNIFPVENETNDPPLEAWLPFVDYANDGGVKEHARAGVIRLKRSSPSAHWTVMNARIVLEQDSNFDGDQHAHSAGVIDRASQGYVLVAVSFGDGNGNNRVELHKINLDGSDRDSYLTGTIDSNTTFHGSRSEDESTTGRLGGQWVGCAPGPNEGEILWGSDVQDDTFSVMLPPDGDGMSEKARYRWIAGTVQTNQGTFRDVFNVFTVRSRKPHLRKDYVADVFSAMNGAMYSPDGEHWAIYGNQGGERFPVWYGDRIANPGGGSDFDIREWEAPEFSIHRPLMLYKGVDQNLDGSSYSSRTSSDAGMTKEFLSRNGNGNFEFPSGHPRAGEELPEQPPTFEANIIRLTADGSGGGFGTIATTSSGGTSVDGMYLAAILNLEGDGGAARPNLYGKGIADGERTTQAPHTQNWKLYYWGSNEFVEDSGFGGSGTIVAGAYDGGDPMPFDCLVALCSIHANEVTDFTDDLCHVAPNASSQPQSFANPIGKIEGVSVGSQWTIAGFCSRPWHPYTAYGNPYVLMSIVEDANNYVEVTADRDGNNDIVLTLDVTVGGTSNTTSLTAGGEWALANVINFAVVRNGDGSTSLIAHAGDREARSASVSAEITGSTLDVKPSAKNDETSVSAFDWSMIVVDDDRALNVDRRQRLIAGNEWRDEIATPPAVSSL